MADFSPGFFIDEAICSSVPLETGLGSDCDLIVTHESSCAQAVAGASRFTKQSRCPRKSVLADSRRFRRIRAVDREPPVVVTSRAQTIARAQPLSEFRIEGVTTVLPLLEGEGWGEVCDLSGQTSHLTLSLSFQERGPAIHSLRPERVG